MCWESKQKITSTKFNFERFNCLYQPTLSEYVILFTCSANACLGVTYTHRESWAAENARRMANSAQMVLPLPVGAPMKTSSSVLYSELNTGMREKGKNGQTKEGKWNERQFSETFAKPGEICKTLTTTTMFFRIAPNFRGTIFSWISWLYSRSWKFYSQNLKSKHLLLACAEYLAGADYIH